MMMSFVMGWATGGRAAMAANFSMEVCVARYESLYHQLLVAQSRYAFRRDFWLQNRA